MIKTEYGKLGIAVLLVLAMVGVTTGQGWAGSVSFLVKIDDLTDTIGLSVTANGGVAPIPTILPDSVGEFLHFTIPLSIPPATSQAQYRALFEDVVGGTLSDQLLVTQTAGLALLNVQFASDPATFAPPPGATIFQGIVETGTYQTLFDVFTPGGAFSFQVKSDRADVPAPATLLLLCSGLAALGGATWRRCRRA